MQFTPKFSGEWYGLALSAGQLFTPPERLAAKCASQPENFAPVDAPRRGRPPKVRADGEDAD